MEQPTSRSGRARIYSIPRRSLPRFRQVDMTIAARAKDRARSSAEEHYLDMVGVTGSIPVAPTSFPRICKVQSGI